MDHGSFGRSRSRSRSQSPHSRSHSSASSLPSTSLAPSRSRLPPTTSTTTTTTTTSATYSPPLLPDTLPLPLPPTGPAAYRSHPRSHHSHAHSHSHSHAHRSHSQPTSPPVASSSALPVRSATTATARSRSPSVVVPVPDLARARPESTPAPQRGTNREGDNSREHIKRLERAERFGIPAPTPVASSASTTKPIGTSRSRLEGVPIVPPVQVATLAPPMSTMTTTKVEPGLTTTAAAAPRSTSTFAATADQRTNPSASPSRTGGFQIPYKSRTSRSRKRSRQDVEDETSLTAAEALESRNREVKREREFEAGYRSRHVSPDRDRERERERERDRDRNRGASRWERIGGGSDRFDRTQSSLGPLTGSNSALPVKRHNDGDLSRLNDASTRYAPNSSARSTPSSSRRPHNQYPTPQSRGIDHELASIGNPNRIDAGLGSSQPSSRKGSNPGTPRARSPDAFSKSRAPASERNRDRSGGGQPREFDVTREMGGRGERLDRDRRESSKLSESVVRARSRSYSPGEIRESSVSSSRRPAYRRGATNGGTPPLPGSSRTRSRSPTSRSQTPTADSHSSRQWRRSPSDNGTYARRSKLGTDEDDTEPVVPISDTPPLPPNRVPKRALRDSPDDDDDNNDGGSVRQVAVEPSDTPPRSSRATPSRLSPPIPATTSNLLPSRRRLPPSVITEPALPLSSNPYQYLVEETKPILPVEAKSSTSLFSTRATGNVTQDDEAGDEEKAKGEGKEEEEEELEEGEEKEEGEIILTPPGPSINATAAVAATYHVAQPRPQSRYRTLPTPAPPPFVSASNATPPISNAFRSRAAAAATTSARDTPPPPPPLRRRRSGQQRPLPLLPTPNGGGVETNERSTTPPLALRRSPLPPAPPPAAATTTSKILTTPAVTLTSTTEAKGLGMRGGGGGGGGGVTSRRAIAETRGETPPPPSPLLPLAVAVAVVRRSPTPPPQTTTTTTTTVRPALPPPPPPLPSSSSEAQRGEADDDEEPRLGPVRSMPDDDATTTAADEVANGSSQATERARRGEGATDGERRGVGGEREEGEICSEVDDTRTVRELDENEDETEEGREREVVVVRHEGADGFEERTRLVEPDETDEQKQGAVEPVEAEVGAIAGARIDESESGQGSDDVDMFDTPDVVADVVAVVNGGEDPPAKVEEEDVKDGTRDADTMQVEETAYEPSRARSEIEDEIVPTIDPEMDVDVDADAGNVGAFETASPRESPQLEARFAATSQDLPRLDPAEVSHPSSTTPLDHHSPPQPISPPTTHAPRGPDDGSTSLSNLEDAKVVSTLTDNRNVPAVPLVEREQWFDATWDDFSTNQGLMIPFLFEEFEERDQRRGEKMIELRKAYRECDRDWQAHVKRLDKLKERHQRKSTTAKHSTTSTAPQTPSIDSSGMPYYPEPVTPGPLALGGGRANRRGGGLSNSTWGYGDAVRSEAEFLEILASLEHADLRDPDVRAARTAAVVPDMAVDPSERAAIVSCAFDDERYRVEDPVEAYGVSTPMDAWSEAEVETFCKGYSQHPKQFGKIAQGLPGRSTADCVLFYYRMKNSIDFRSLSDRRGRDGRRKKTKKRPGEGKGKGSSLLSNLKGAKSTMLGHRDEDDDEDDEDRSVLASPRNARPPLPPTNPATLVPPRADPTPATHRPLASALDRLFEDDPNDLTPGATSKSTTAPTPRVGNAQLLSEGMMEAAEVLGALGVVSNEDPSETEAASLRPRAAKTNRKVRMDLDDDGAIETVASTEKLRPKRKANSSSYWSAAEKADILRLLELHGKNWKAIGEEMGTKTAVQCRNWFTNNAKKLGLRNRSNGNGERDYDDQDDESPAVTPLVQSPAVARAPSTGASLASYFPTPDANQLPPLPSIPTSDRSQASKAGMHLRNMLNEDMPEEEASNSAKEDWFGGGAEGRDDDASDDDSPPVSAQSSHPVTATERVLPPQNNRIILSNGVARPSSHLPPSSQLPSFPTSLPGRRFDHFLPHQSASMPIPSHWSPAPGSPFASYGSPATPGPPSTEHYRRPTPPDYFQAKSAAFPHPHVQLQSHHHSQQQQRFSAPPGSVQPSPPVPSTSTFAAMRPGPGPGPGPGTVLPPSASLYQPRWTPDPRR